jgi:hypothetical protein
MSIARFQLVALDCPDPVALCAFYQKLAGGTINVERSSDDWMRLEMANGVAIGFQRDLAYVAPASSPSGQLRSASLPERSALSSDRQAGSGAPAWPDGAPQQAHLDFFVDDLDAGEAEVLAIGARKTDTQPLPSEWRVFLDPVGHPFCLVTD